MSKLMAEREGSRGPSLTLGIPEKQADLALETFPANHNTQYGKRGLYELPRRRHGYL